MWMRVLIYSYEHDNNVIIGDVEANDEEEAIETAKSKVIYEPIRKQYAEDVSFIEKVIREGSHGNPWFWVAVEIDEPEHPIMEGFFSGMNHIELINGVRISPNLVEYCDYLGFEFRPIAHENGHVEMQLRRSENASNS
jgi:hypothetical protein